MERATISRQQQTQRAFLGAALMDPARAREYIIKLVPGMFDEGVSRAVFSAVQQLTMAGEPVDVITVINRASAGRPADEIRPGVVAMAETCPSVSNIGSYAAQILEDYRYSLLQGDLMKCMAKDAMDSDGVCFVYWEVTRGTAPRNHLFPNVEPNLLINITESKLTDLRNPCKLITEEDTRFYHCNIKTLNLLPSVMASQKAFEAGAKEVVFHRGNRVTECAHTNVNIIKNGVYITPPLDELILPGVTRRHYISLCQRLGIPYQERTFTLEELFDADEVFITSAGTLGLPAYEIDQKKVGGKAPELLKKLQKAAVEDFEKETGYKADII